MKENKLSRRTFVRVSTASVAALSLPSIATAQSDAPQQQRQQERQPPTRLRPSPGTPMRSPAISSIP